MYIQMHGATHLSVEPDLYGHVELLHAGQHVLLEDPQPGEETPLSPAPLNVIKIYPQSMQKGHAPTIYGHLLGPIEQLLSTPLLLDDDTRSSFGSDGNEGTGEANGASTDYVDRSASPVSADTVVGGFGDEEYGCDYGCDGHGLKEDGIAGG